MEERLTILDDQYSSTGTYSVVEGLIGESQTGHCFNWLGINRPEELFDIVCESYVPEGGATRILCFMRGKTHYILVDWM